MDSVAKFAVEAAAFERWLLSGTDREADAARECLIRLLALYGAGIELPPEWSDELEGRADVEGVGDAEWRSAYEASRRLPLDNYSEVFDPTMVPAEAAVIGSLSDDLADIYRDIVTGLRAYRRGDRAGAVWEWSFNLHAHWGLHATGAMRILHWWLCNNAPNRLCMPVQAPAKGLHLTAAVRGVRRLLVAVGRRSLQARPAAVVASWFARGRR